MQNRQITYVRALEVFKSFAGANNLSSNGYRAKDTTMYINSDLKGQGGAIQLVDANTKKIEGITNFDGNTLNTGHYIVLDSLRARFDGAATSFGAAEWNGVAVPAVRNATLVIHQDENLFEIPVNDILGKAQANSNDDDFRDIAHFPILQAGIPFEIELKFPKGVSVPGDSESRLRLEFRALQVILK